MHGLVALASVANVGQTNSPSGLYTIMMVVGIVCVLGGLCFAQHTPGRVASVGFGTVLSLAGLILAS